MLSWTSFGRSEEIDSDTDDKISDTVWTSGRRIEPQLVNSAEAVPLIKQRYRRLVLRDCTLHIADLATLRNDDVLNTTITLCSIETPEPIDEHFSLQGCDILSKFGGIRFIKSVEMPSNDFNVYYNLKNLERLSVLTTMPPEYSAIMLHDTFSRLRHIEFGVDTPSQLGWFAQFEFLQTLMVNSVCDNSGDNPPPKTIKRLHLENCSKAETFNFLPYIYASKELYIVQAPNLQIEMLHLCLDRCPSHLQTLSLSRTSAVCDILLECLLQNGITLKKLKVPLLADSKCLGFSIESLYAYMDFNNGLEQLLIRGHRQIDSTLWTFPAECFAKMVWMDVCETGIKTMEHVLEFGPKFKNRQSLISTLLGQHHVYLNIEYNGVQEQYVIGMMLSSYGINIAFYGLDI
jgi:hypothetical protein